MKYRIVVFFVAAMAACRMLASAGENVIGGLMERLCPGLSERIEVVIEGNDSVDFFELSQAGERPRITASDKVSAAAGLHHYLKYFVGRPVSWDYMRVELPERLPAVDEHVRRETSLRQRYYLNYCTHSYSMAFWDFARWEREIDWMALHGINMPLAVTGSEAVWQSTLRRLGYGEDEILDFIAGPGFQAWWLMNNLEGWGGRVSQGHIDRESEKQKRILERMRELGMEPVLAGYSGMLPHDGGERLGLDVADPGRWLGYRRPAFLQPTDSAFGRIADVYYEELTRLYGGSNYYSADPFHEGGNTSGVDLGKAGEAILGAMRRVNPKATWVAQGWQENPRREILEALPRGSVAVLDLQAENKPLWDEHEDGFAGQPWLYCMLLNFGGNVGLYGKMTAMTEGFERARQKSGSLSGIGLTMEGIENNPVMTELMTELPWIEGGVDVDVWVADYARARYGGGVLPAGVAEAWQLLRRSIYDSPSDSVQQGCTESVFCARPSKNPRRVSSWVNDKDYYRGEDVVRAAELMARDADLLVGNAHFDYDLTDVVRQGIAELGRMKLQEVKGAAGRGDSATYRKGAEEFVELMMIQDSLLDLHEGFRLERWLAEARRSGVTDAEKAVAEWNARTQITVWGNREASDGGGLHDYAHKEWSGMLRDFYAPRWRRWFDYRLANWGGDAEEIDWFVVEEPWTRERGGYDKEPRRVDDLAGEVRRLFGRAKSLGN